jgi:hypothetical protein
MVFLNFNNSRLHNLWSLDTLTLEVSIRVQIHVSCVRIVVRNLFTCKQKSWLKCVCFLYKIHVTLQCIVVSAIKKTSKVNTILKVSFSNILLFYSPWQSHDRESLCLRGRRHSSILYSPSGFFSSYFINEVNF